MTNRFNTPNTFKPTNTTTNTTNAATSTGNAAATSNAPESIPMPEMVDLRRMESTRLEFSDMCNALEFLTNTCPLEEIGDKPGFQWMLEKLHERLIELNTVMPWVHDLFPSYWGRGND